MRIKIKDNNKISNSNIGNNNTIKSDKKEKYIVKIIIEIAVGILVSVIGGYILYKLNIN